MWLKKLLKQSNYGTGWAPSGGGGSDLGVASDNVLGLNGQEQIFEDAALSQEKQYNARRRLKKRKMLERKRKWRLSKDQPPK